MDYNMYKRGKIYKLTGNGLIYFGSTTQPLNVRIGGHRQHYRYYLNGKRGFITSFKLFENDEETKITLVEDFACDRKEQLLARERWYIENNDCVNKTIPTRTHKEWLHTNKENQLEKNKLYKEKNKEQIKEKNKEYNEINKEHIKQYKSTEFTCTCGMKMHLSSKHRHLETKKHLVLLKNNIYNNNISNERLDEPRIANEK